jgi:hypothetical protein
LRQASHPLRSADVDRQPGEKAAAASRAYAPRMRDLEVIDSELRLLLSIRRTVCEVEGRPPSAAHVDALLDERIRFVVQLAFNDRDDETGTPRAPRRASLWGSPPMRTPRCAWSFRYFADRGVVCAEDEARRTEPVNLNEAPLRGIY